MSEAKTAAHGKFVRIGPTCRRVDDDLMRFVRLNAFRTGLARVCCNTL